MAPRDMVKRAIEFRDPPRMPLAFWNLELGERLALDHPFCLVWYEREGRRYVSLRSRAGGADVSRIAQAHGGGGHRHAASFSMPIGEGMPMLFEIVAAYIR